MFANTTKVLLVLSWDVLDRARVLAGKATSALKLPVSLQIVLRALIEQGLKGGGDRAVLASVERQAKAVRQSRSLARHGAHAGAPQRLATRRMPSNGERRGHRE